MNRRGSKDISAIEDRIISQSERAARIRAEMAAEAQENMERLAAASMLSSTAIVDPHNGKRNLPRNHGSNFAAEAERVARRKLSKDDVENQRVSRDPCFKCGVRQDQHGEFGCKTWRGK